MASVVVGVLVLGTLIVFDCGIWNADSQEEEDDDGSCWHQPGPICGVA